MFGLGPDKDTKDKITAILMKGGYEEEALNYEEGRPAQQGVIEAMNACMAAGLDHADAVLLQREISRLQPRMR